MFTGLIEEVGKLNKLASKGDFLRLTVSCKTILDDIVLGTSIAINGVCLTVVEFDSLSFTVEAVKETLRKTTINELNIGDLLNLERALRANARLGGHFVLGHIDCKAKVVQIKKESFTTILEFEVPGKYMRYLISKGSIGINGISLTIAEVDSNKFSCSIIPHTLHETNLSSLKVGSLVNIEFDILGKYIEKFVNVGSDCILSKESKITESWLHEKGF